MKRKGFTLVELLVVIAIIALLMSILMPALAQVRRLANRMLCGTNLSGLGKAMATYANDNEDEFVRAGMRKSVWATEILDWDPEPQPGVNTEPLAFGPLPAPGDSGNDATIGSCWFLLVKYADSTAKQFVCKGDDGTKVFSLDEYPDSPLLDHDLTDAWDFGDLPGNYYSYSYHHPFESVFAGGSWALSSDSNPASPVAADRNPWLDKNALKGRLADDDLGDASWNDTTKSYEDFDKKENSASHEYDGQNVLFMDGHVEFLKAPNVGIQKDNIYKCWFDTVANVTPEIRQLSPGMGNNIAIGELYGPSHKDDAFLVNDIQDGEESSDDARQN